MPYYIKKDKNNNNKKYILFIHIPKTLKNCF